MVSYKMQKKSDIVIFFKALRTKNEAAYNITVFFDCCVHRYFFWFLCMENAWSYSVVYARMACNIRWRNKFFLACRSVDGTQFLFSKVRSRRKSSRTRTTPILKVILKRLLDCLIDSVCRIIEIYKKNKTRTKIEFF